MAKAETRKHASKTAERRADVDRDMDRLKGVSTKDLTPDDRRAASSPLGHGEKRKSGRK
jgi:hypothetical protein